MLSDSIYIYCDASFSKIYQIAIIGSLIFKNNNEHQFKLSSEAQSKLIQIREINNIRAEIKGVILALQSCPREKHIVLFTDCQTLSELIRRRPHLEKSNYISKNKKAELANADLYKKFYLLYDQIKPEIFWVKGHSEKSNATLQQKHFSYIDKMVRSKLRSVVSDLSK